MKELVILWSVCEFCQNVVEKYCEFKQMITEENANFNKQLGKNI